MNGCRFHALSRDRPELLLQVELRPSGASNFEETLTGQEQEADHRSVAPTHPVRPMPSRDHLIIGQHSLPGVGFGGRAHAEEG
jgi:hypothetical protein